MLLFFCAVTFWSEKLKLDFVIYKLDTFLVSVIVKEIPCFHRNVKLNFRCIHMMRYLPHTFIHVTITKYVSRLWRQSYHLPPTYSTISNAIDASKIHNLKKWAFLSHSSHFYLPSDILGYHSLYLFFCFFELIKPHTSHKYVSDDCNCVIFNCFPGNNLKLNDTWHQNMEISSCSIDSYVFALLKLCTVFS